jgi:hypothetical protein
MITLDLEPILESYFWDCFCKSSFEALFTATL